MASSASSRMTLACPARAEAAESPAMPPPTTSTSAVATDLFLPAQWQEFLELYSSLQIFPEIMGRAAICTALRAKCDEHLCLLQRRFPVQGDKLLTKPLLFASDAFDQGAMGLFGIH